MFLNTIYVLMTSQIYIHRPDFDSGVQIDQSTPNSMATPGLSREDLKLTYPTKLFIVNPGLAPSSSPSLFTRHQLL